MLGSLLSLCQVNLIFSVSKGPHQYAIVCDNGFKIKLFSSIVSFNLELGSISKYFRGI